MPKQSTSPPPPIVDPLVALIRLVLQVTIPWLIACPYLQGGYFGNVHNEQDAMDDVSLAGSSPNMEAGDVVRVSHGRWIRRIGEPVIGDKPHLE